MARLYAYLALTVSRIISHQAQESHGAPYRGLFPLGAVCPAYSQQGSLCETDDRFEWTDQSGQYGFKMPLGKQNQFLCLQYGYAVNLNLKVAKR